MRIFLPTVALCFLAACQQAAEPPPAPEPDNSVGPIGLPPSAPADAPVGAIIDPASDDAARAIADAYGKALAEGRFADARAMWSDGGNASGRDPSAFAAAFAGVEGLELGLGEPGAKEGAAGSIYIEIPATLTGTGTGGPWRVEEPVILRRVNNVDGSTEEQRRWHIAKAPFPPDARE